jgi:hypothetical protein
MRTRVSGFRAFFCTLGAGLVVTVLLVNGVPAEVPHPVEAHEGFGDRAPRLIWFAVGTAISLVAATIAAMVFSLRRTEPDE